MADDLLTQLPAPTEADTKFEQSAAWDADSTAHDPTDAGNDAVPAVAAPEPESAVTEPEPTEETPAVETPRNDQGQFVKKGKGKPRSDPQARVEQATAKEAAAKEEARLAREEAAQLKARLEAVERAQRVVQTQTAPQPPADFPGYDDWVKANPGKDWDVYHRELTRHEARLIAQQTAAQQVAQWQQQQRQAQQATLIEQRTAAAKAKYADWDQVLETGNKQLEDGLRARGLLFPMDVFREALTGSEQGAEILRDLALHPDVALQLAVETQGLPVSAAPMLRRFLESRLTASAAPVPPDSAPAAPVSTARPPVNRVGGTASAVPIDPDDLEFGPEYVRVENERERKRVAAGRW